MSTATHCAFCRQPFEPGEGKLQDQAGAFHPRCFAVYRKVAESRTCGCCNLAIQPEDECVGRFGEGPTLRYHKACFAAVGAAHPKPTRRCEYCGSPDGPYDKCCGQWPKEAKPTPAEPEAKASPKVCELVIELKVDKAKAREAFKEAMLDAVIVVQGGTRAEAQAYIDEMAKQREAKAARKQRLGTLLMHLGVDVANLRGVLTDVSGYLDKVEKGHADLKALVDSWDAEAESDQR